jgi:hypothetical protein
MEWTGERCGEAAGVAPTSRASNRVRLLLVLIGLACRLPAAARGAMPTDPAAFTFSAGGDLYIGNSTHVPGPVGANGAILLDERVRVPLALARRDFKMKLLSTVLGDATSVGGAARLMNQTRVGGSLCAARGVTVGVAASVDGDVTAAAGDVRLVRNALVAGDVYADRDFRGERDVTVGSPGSRLEIRGDAIIRDRGEYFASILHEGSLAVLGNGEPTFHAGVVAVSHGTLASPGMAAWRLDTLALPQASPGAGDVTVTKKDGVVVLPPGRYRVVTLEQQARMVLTAGVYHFDHLVSQSDADIRVDLPGAGDALELRVRRDVRPGRRFVLDLGTKNAELRRDRAARIRTIAGGAFRGDQDVVWAGAILSGKGLSFGKHTTLVGSAWTKGDLEVGRDAVVDWVPLGGAD